MSLRRWVELSRPSDGRGQRTEPLAAICVQSVDVQCVLQFTLVHAAGCVLHRRTSRVIHRLKLFSCFGFGHRRGTHRGPDPQRLCERTAGDALEISFSNNGYAKAKVTKKGWPGRPPHVRRTGGLFEPSPGTRQPRERELPGFGAALVAPSFPCRTYRRPPLKRERGSPASRQDRYPKVMVFQEAGPTADTRLTPATMRTPPFGLQITNSACVATTSNDPSAGSPTETLLRLLLPLNDQVRASSRPTAPPGEGRAETNPRPSLNRSIGSSDGRCVQRAGT
eukprot:TRINITY_DN266_c0_g1_i3.p1 TRINITY_DN266_c0_g1~~TRINITY_DN266_c0_g1_i3.p1  ORF type:complete len:280 (-),score=-8.14 TRINITY_DN266_c0_g1_i3:149-988(-)